jgi:hypothetical protein
VPCEELDSCRAASPPQVLAPALPTLANGNVVSSAGGKPTRAKPLTRAQRLAKALRSCRKKHGKRRKACEVRAKRRFGPVHKKHGRNRRKR